MSFFFGKNKKKENEKDGDDDEKKNIREKSAIERQPSDAQLREQKLGNQAQGHSDDKHVGKSILKGIEYGRILTRYEREEEDCQDAS